MTWIAQSDSGRVARNWRRRVRVATGGALLAVGGYCAWWLGAGVGDASFGIFIFVPFCLAALALLLRGVGALRLVRLTAGGTAAVCGALLTLSMGDLGGAGDPFEIPAPVDVLTNQGLLVGLLTAVAGTWTADVRLARRAAAAETAREALAAGRHAELLARAQVHPTAARAPWLRLATVVAAVLLATRTLGGAKTRRWVALPSLTRSRRSRRGA